MTDRRTRGALVLATLTAALLGVSDAAAERIVLLNFSGRKASVLREKVADALERAGHTVVKNKASSKRVSAKTIKRLGKRADIVLAGEVQRAREGDWSVALSVNDPKTGKRLGEKIEFDSEWLPGLTKDLTDNVSRRVEAVMAGEEDSAKPPPPAPEPEPEPEVASLETKAALADSESTPGEGGEGDAASSGDETVADSGPEDDDPLSSDGVVIRLRGRGGFVRRNFDFADDIYDRLRKQGTNIWVYQAQAEVYPFERPIGQRLGLILSYEGTLSGNVRDTDFGITYPVQFSEFFGGVRARHPLGKHQIGFDLTFGQMSSGLDDGDGDARIPDLKYTLMRASLDFKLDLGAFDATGSAGFRLPLGFGEASETRWFPRMGGYGFEASAGLVYPVSKRLSLEAMGSMRRYLLEMNSEPQDALNGVSEVAAGAVDLYLSAYFGVSFTL
ncbi:MAG TPA: hypothetical protein VMG12_40020 [Polyangiaceae bacterium]|nr:hypothetical protein [Polyangiaceae bacterium]